LTDGHLSVGVLSYINFHENDRQRIPMPIPSSQLETWANQGAIVTAQATHTSIRTALSLYNWPDGIRHDEYLQGSYRNNTNIRGDSDVDLVTELTSTFWSNLTEEEKREMGITPASYTWSDYRSDLIHALRDYYGDGLIDTSGSRSVKVLPSSGRLHADIVVAGQYRHYSNMRLIAQGIIFWTTPGGQLIKNYPKLHYSNGTNKNSQERTGTWYKPTIRIYKNARNRIYNNKPHLDGRFPSYFIECLLHNVPDDRFGGGYQNSFVNVVNWLNEVLNNTGGSKFTTQNGMEYLFGPLITQWNQNDARLFISELIDLWNEW
jgi:hypothetical protein